MCLGLLNRYRKEGVVFDHKITSVIRAKEYRDLHRCLPGYAPTPLVRRPALARRLGLKEIMIKDESHRLGLNAFKVLGASYAMYCLFKRNGWIRPEADRLEVLIPPRSVTVCTATDGNHGRAIARTARFFSQRAVIFMPRETVAARIANIEKEGAEVVVVDGHYDDAVAEAANQAAQHGWLVVSDTAYPGYEDIPLDIMAGYLTLFNEVDERTDRRDTEDAGYDIVLLQGGVGSLAASACWYYVNRYGKKRPRLVVIEPMQAACLLASAASPGGVIGRATGSQQTIMAGLNCGTPSLVAWPVLRDAADAFIAISDEYAVEAMRRMYYPEDNDERIVSGESGAAGLAGLLALLAEPSLAGLRSDLGIDRSTRVLVLNTEGDTDPDNFRRLTAE